MNDINEIILSPAKRGRPKKFTDDEQKEKRSIAQKAIRDKRNKALKEWRENIDKSQLEFILLLQKYVINDEELINEMKLLSEKIKLDLMNK